MAESSATAGRPVATAAARALISAFSAKVVPVSGGSSIPAGKISSSCGRSSTESSRSLCGLREASTKRIGAASAERDGRNGLLLRHAQALDPGRGQGQQLVERRPGERGALAGGLHLDES